MNKRELLKLLESIPDDTEIYVSERGGCSECTPEFTDVYHAADFEYAEVPVKGYRIAWEKVVIL